jgi:hypothetical protein
MNLSETVTMLRFCDLSLENRRDVARRGNSIAVALYIPNLILARGDAGAGAGRLHAVQSRGKKERQKAWPGIGAYESRVGIRGTVGMNPGRPKRPLESAGVANLLHIRHCVCFQEN